MKVSFVIPTFKQTNLVTQCLESLRKYHKDHEVIVVDDGSPKDVQGELKNICEKYNAKLKASYWNNGFGFNSNRGIDAATGDIVILVNNDITFTCDITEEVIERMQEDEKIGIIGFLLYYPNGRIQHGGHKRVPNYLGFAHADHGKPEEKAYEAYQDRYICGVTGALIALKKDMVDEIGGFKAGYGLAYEDVEICIRAWHAHWKVYYTSQVSAVHHEGYTRGTNDIQKKSLGCYEMEEKSKAQFIKDLLTFDLHMMDQKVAYENKSISEKPKEIAVFNRKGAIGDCIMTTGIIEEYKRRFPNDEILVSTICSYPYNVNPAVTKVFSNTNLTSKLAHDYCDLDMVYERDIKKPVWIAFADYVFGEGNYKEENILPKLYSQEEDYQSLAEKVADLQVDLSGEIAVIHPSRSWECKTWSKENWDKVVDFLLTKNLKVVIIGAGGDIEPTLKPNVFNFKNRIDLKEVRALIDQASLFVGIDSGCMHIAMTTKTPVVGIFTSADPDYFIHRKENVLAVIPNIECQFCRHEQPNVTSVDCDKDNACIKAITHYDVENAIKEFIS